MVGPSSKCWWPFLGYVTRKLKGYISDLQIGDKKVTAWINWCMCWLGGVDMFWWRCLLDGCLVEISFVFLWWILSDNFYVYCFFCCFRLFACFFCCLSIDRFGGYVFFFTVWCSLVVQVSSCLKGFLINIEKQWNFSGMKVLLHFGKLHPWRLTWNIIIEVWKIIFLSKWVICRFHVNLPGCNSFLIGNKELTAAPRTTDSSHWARSRLARKGN